MHILLSNDDGIMAPGLRELAYHLAKDHRITVVAPMREQSGKAHAITTDRAIEWKVYPAEENIEWHAIDGTPSDCVKWALSHYLKGDKPDLCISGINNGLNVGSDALYSGTVAAAMEALFFGVPGLALSATSYKRGYGKELYPVVDHLIASYYGPNPSVKALPRDLVLNVNFPAEGPYTWNKVRQLAQGTQHYRDSVEFEMIRRGKKYFWIGGKKDHDREAVPTDVDQVLEGFITVVPLTWKQEYKDFHM